MDSQQLVIDTVRSQFNHDVLPIEVHEPAMEWIAAHTARALSGIAFYNANTEKLAPDQVQKEIYRLQDNYAKDAMVYSRSLLTTYAKISRKIGKGGLVKLKVRSSICCEEGDKDAVLIHYNALQKQGFTPSLYMDHGFTTDVVTREECYSTIHLKFVCDLNAPPRNEVVLRTTDSQQFY